MCGRRLLRAAQARQPVPLGAGPGPALLRAWRGDCVLELCPAAAYGPRAACGRTVPGGGFFQWRWGLSLARANNGSLTSRAGTPDGRGRLPMPYLPTPRSSPPFPRGVPGRRRKRTSPPEQRATVFTRTSRLTSEQTCSDPSNKAAGVAEAMQPMLGRRRLSLPSGCHGGCPVT